MMSIELTDISAKLSDMITKWNPLFTKVDRVVDKRTFEVSPSVKPVNKDQFWEGCEYNVNLSSEEKDKIYLRYHRSHNCAHHVQLFALALKKLCDKGISFSHKGAPVLDFAVLSDDEFDLSDKLNIVLTFRDSRTGVKLPGMSTYANIAVLRRHGPTMARRFSVRLPEVAKRCEDMRTNNFSRYLSTAPYMWIAATIQDGRYGILLRKMVHIDICAAGFENSAFYPHTGSCVSLNIFETPEYELFPATDLPKVLKPEKCDERFIMRSYRRVHYKTRTVRFSFVLPQTSRHMRAYTRKDASHVLLTPLETYISKECPKTAQVTKWLDLITAMHEKILLRVPAGTKVSFSKTGHMFTMGNGGSNVTTSNFQMMEGRHLKECDGSVHSSVTKDTPVRYVPVVVSKGDDPIWIEAKKLRLTTRKQYLSYSELLTRVAEFQNPLTEQLSTESIEMTQKSTEDQAALETALRNTKSLKAAYTVMAFGKVVFSFLEDRDFVNGMRRLLLPPFGNRFLSAGDIDKVKRYIEVAEYPNSKKGWEILRKMSALRTQTKHWRIDAGIEDQAGNLTAAGRAYANGAGPSEGNTKMDDNEKEFHEVVKALARVTERARRDRQMVRFYAKMEDLGLAPNPFSSFAT